VFSDCRIRFNKRGYSFGYSDLSRPNAITMRDCIVGANDLFGGLVVGAATFNMRGGAIEGNGAGGGGTGWGVKIENAGVEGGVGVEMDGVYCEGNAGIADLWITQSTEWAMHSVMGSSFVRYLASQYVTQNIFLDVAAGIAEKSRLALAGNAFKSMGAYTENGSRPYWTAPVGSVFDKGGNQFSGATALPNPASRALTGPPQYAWGSVPTPGPEAIGGQALLTDTSSGPVLAWWDGTNWLKVKDDVVVT
jgi:hypothetical protein